MNDSLLQLLPYICFSIFSVLLFIVTIFTGQIIERSHFRDIRKREKALKGRILIHNRKSPVTVDIRRMECVSGSVVIAADRFKTWLARWRQVVGGRMGSLEPVVERARREALLRTAEKAVSMGYSELGNIRYQFTSLKRNNPQQKELLVSVMVYGTAYSG